jgi:cephalosporin hydroxylase
MSDASPDVKLIERQKTVDDFANLWYPLQNIFWMGYELQKCPLDLWIYQEIMYECRPDFIIECGTWKGGSALYLAHLCDVMNHGMVLSIDLTPWIGVPQHSRVAYLGGNSVDEALVKQVTDVASGFRKVMVILDSDHAKDHVLKELEAYAPLVTRGQYLIVEDSNIHGHPVRLDHPPGPYEAIQEWYPKNDGQFYQDKMCERFLLTHNPNGYLRRVR